MAVSFKEGKEEKKNKRFLVAFVESNTGRTGILYHKNKCQVLWSKINGFWRTAYFLWYVPLLCFLIMDALRVKPHGSSQQSTSVKTWQKSVCNESLELDFL